MGNSERKTEAIRQLLKQADGPSASSSVLPATPESNRWQFHRDNGHAREHVIVVPAVFAQRLERERDELRERIASLNTVVTGDWESKDAFIARVRAILFDAQNAPVLARKPAGEDSDS